jgi:hypothetical protein
VWARSGDLLWIERVAPGPLAAGPSGGDPVPCSLGDQTPLEMRDRSEHVEDQLAGGRVGVDPFLQAEQSDAALLEHRDRGQQFAERSSDPVETHDRERIALAGLGEQGLQARPLHCLAGTDIAENLNGAGLGQPHGLAGDSLIASRHSRIAENATHCVSQTTVLWTPLSSDWLAPFFVQQIRPAMLMRPNIAHPLLGTSMPLFK